MGSFLMEKIFQLSFDSAYRVARGLVSFPDPPPKRKGGLGVLKGGLGTRLLVGV